MAKLLIQESAGVREFELVDNEVHMGRELDNTLRLADPSVSRHHAVLRKTETGFEVQDLQSSNGVLVNGTRIQSSPVQDGDRLTVGQIQMTFSDPKPLPEVGATVAVQVTPESPLGTVRMTAADIAKIQAQGPESGATSPANPVVPAPAPAPAPPVVVPPVAAPSVGQATAVAPPPAAAATARGPVASNPAPAFLRPLLPPVPDDAQPVMLNGQVERGDFVTRLLAHLIDGAFAFGAWICIFIVMSILGFILGAISPALLLLLFPLTMLLYLVLAFGFLAGTVWCWMRFGATPGKKIMKLRVVPENDITGRVDLNTAILRVLGHWVNGILFSLPYLMILGEERKGLQDIFSKSIVIKVDR